MVNVMSITDMKKFLPLFVLFLIFSIGMSAQTYCYKILFKVDAETGTKSEASGLFYVTFIKEKKCCYESDVDGFAIKGEHMQAAGVEEVNWPYYYRGKSDGIYTLQSSRSEDILSYRCLVEVTVNWVPNPLHNSYEHSKKYKYVSFTKDYSRINVGVDQVTVGERVLKPGATPDSLY